MQITGLAHRQITEPRPGAQRRLQQETPLDIVVVEIAQALHLHEIPRRRAAIVVAGGSHGGLGCRALRYLTRTDRVLRNRIVQRRPDGRRHPVRIHRAALCAGGPALRFIVADPCRFPAPARRSIGMIGHLHNHVALQQIARPCSLNHITVRIQHGGRSRGAGRIVGTRPDLHIADTGHRIARLSGPELYWPPGTILNGGGQRLLAEHGGARIGEGGVAATAHEQTQRLVAHCLSRILAESCLYRIGTRRSTGSIPLFIHNHQEVNGVLHRRLPLQLFAPGAAAQRQRRGVRREDQSIRVVRCRGRLLKDRGGGDAKDIGGRAEPLHVHLERGTYGYSTHRLFGIRKNADGRCHDRLAGLFGGGCSHHYIGDHERQLRYGCISAHSQYVKCIIATHWGALAVLADPFTIQNGSGQLRGLHLASGCVDAGTTVHEKQRSVLGNIQQAAQPIGFVRHIVSTGHRLQIRHTGLCGNRHIASLQTCGLGARIPEGGAAAIPVSCGAAATEDPAEGSYDGAGTRTAHEHIRPLAALEQPAEALREKRGGGRRGRAAAIGRQLHLGFVAGGRHSHPRLLIRAPPSLAHHRDIKADTEAARCNKLKALNLPEQLGELRPAPESLLDLGIIRRQRQLPLELRPRRVAREIYGYRASYALFQHGGKRLVGHAIIPAVGLDHPGSLQREPDIIC